MNRRRFLTLLGATALTPIVPAAVRPVMEFPDGMMSAADFSAFRQDLIVYGRAWCLVTGEQVRYMPFSGVNDPTEWRT